MLKKPLFRRSSASAAVGVDTTLHLCTIRFLDDSEPMSVRYKVACLLYYKSAKQQHNKLPMILAVNRQFFAKGPKISPVSVKRALATSAPHRPY